MTVTNHSGLAGCRHSAVESDTNAEIHRICFDHPDSDVLFVSHSRGLDADEHHADTDTNRTLVSPTDSLPK